VGAGEKKTRLTSNETGSQEPKGPGVSRNGSAGTRDERREERQTMVEVKSRADGRRVDRVQCGRVFDGVGAGASKSGQFGQLDQLVSLLNHG
jgi:hypothetical protein